MRKKLGECLIQAGLITDEDLQSALAEHKRTGERLGAVLVRLNLATERQIAKALATGDGASALQLEQQLAMETRRIQADAEEKRAAIREKR